MLCPPYVIFRNINNKSQDELCIAFDNLSQDFVSSSFLLADESLRIAQENGLDQKIKIGDTVDFIAAPRYFGDGYLIPIAAIAVNGEVLLDFDTGYENLLEQL